MVPASRTHRRGQSEGAAEPGGVDDHVSAFSVGQGEHLSEDSVIRAVNGLVDQDRLGAHQAARQRQPFGRFVDGDHAASTHQRRLDEVCHAKRTHADHGHGVARSETTGPTDGYDPLEAVGNGEDLGQDGDLGRQIERHPEHGRPGLQVEEL